MAEFKIDYFFETDGEEFNELFYKGLEDFISEKINLQLYNWSVFSMNLRCVCFTKKGDRCV